MKLVLALVLSALLLLEVSAFTRQHSKQKQNGALFVLSSRRKALKSLLVGGNSLLIGTAPSLAVERAVGSAEISCREKGDCLEKFELDGAVGWNWGAKDRCDSTDPRCGNDGVMRDAPPAGQPVPETTSEITHTVEFTCAIGKEETGTIKLGLYGEACPQSVGQLVEFLSLPGLVTGSKLMLEDGYGVVSTPVTLATGYGLLTEIVPQQRLVFGIPSQAAAYAKSKGKAKAGDDFQPQARPNREATRNEQSVRKHDVAGLLSIPHDGLGYANNANDDEAFESAFEITAASVPVMDKKGRKVIGQVLDAVSMTVVARLASLPTKKGLKGVIPGQSSGPPLLKVVVQEVNTKALALAAAVET